MDNENLLLLSLAYMFDTLAYTTGISVPGLLVAEK